MLDTNIVVAYLNGNEPIASKVVDNIAKISISTLVVAELDYGAKASRQSSRNLSVLNRFIELVRIVPFDLNCARMMGTIKANLRKIGRPTGEVDVMIAAVAMAHKAELITGNTRHFEHIEGLKLASW